MYNKLVKVCAVGVSLDNWLGSHHLERQVIHHRGGSVKCLRMGYWSFRLYIFYTKIHTQVASSLAKVSATCPRMFRMR